MNSRPERSQDPYPPQPEQRLLPSGSNKIERITQHSRELVDDLTDWVELKIKLTQLEVQEKIDAKVNGLIVKAMPMVVGALGGLFLLVTIALGLGWLLGHPFWGFLIVTGVLLAVAGILKSRSRQIADSMAGEHRIRVGADAATNGHYGGGGADRSGASASGR